jgi:uncharacterized membrane protein
MLITLPVEIAWHHLHPILVNFTAALVPASVGSDLLGRLMRRNSLTSAAWWMILYAAIATPGTALVGWMWKRQVEAGLPAETILRHQWVGVGLAIALILMAAWRGAIYAREQSPGVVYFLAAFCLLAALIYEGNLGGSMVFG